MTTKNDRDRDEAHPSYGMVGLSRTMNGTRGTRLFGSALDNHQGTMRLTVKRGVRRRENGHDWYFAREYLIDIEMSAAQFVEFITNPNVGDGVPCTIRYARDEGTGGKLERMDDVPDAPTEIDHIRSSFASSLTDMIGTMKARRAEIDKITAGLSARARESLRVGLDVITQQLASNVPYILTQLEEASGKVVTAAKHEVEAFVATVLRSAGMEAIAEGRMPKALAPPRPWDGLCQAGKHGLDYQSQACDVCAEGNARANASGPSRVRATAVAVTTIGHGGRGWRILDGAHAGIVFAVSEGDRHRWIQGQDVVVRFSPDDQFAFVDGLKDEAPR